MSGRPGPSAPGNPGPITKVQEVQLQVEEVSNVMRDNVSQMLSNYEKAEVLEDKAANLTQESKKFYKRSNAVKQNMCMKNAKMYAMIALIVIIIIIVITVPVVVNGVAAAKAVKTAQDAAAAKNNDTSP
ncbi:synaptobrevin-domain-containing protein [Pavlovales sp. CCMP2436]|nr:synaptobrevin-domain-containing protein [Pavlovales sp. CCMP2436]|mmetsp:Transcript_9884/g.24824  ORF Transcript_9884/g.24824 Transcript_9884/m.24824 type:complete len:129 (-) Transcript_9884:464-850(-)